MKKSSPPFPPKSTFNSTSLNSSSLPVNTTGAFHSSQSDHKPPTLITTSSSLSTTNTSTEGFAVAPNTHNPPSHTHRGSAHSHPHQSFDVPSGGGGDSENISATDARKRKRGENGDHKDKEKRKKKKHKHLKGRFCCFSFYIVCVYIRSSYSPEFAAS